MSACQCACMYDVISRALDALLCRIAAWQSSSCTFDCCRFCLVMQYTCTCIYALPLRPSSVRMPLSTHSSEPLSQYGYQTLKLFHLELYLNRTVWRSQPLSWSQLLRESYDSWGHTCAILHLLTTVFVISHCHVTSGIWIGTMIGVFQYVLQGTIVSFSCRSIVPWLMWQ